VALDALYSAIPVHSLIDEDRFVAKHASGYCEAQNNISVEVPVCRSAFQINIIASSRKDALTPLESFSIGTLPLVAFIFVSVATPYLTKHI